MSAEARPTTGHPGQTLEQDEVHVWSASLDQPADAVARLRTLLDEVEKQRADRFLFEKGRNQFTIGRGVLRLLLGRYLGIEPREVRFRYNPHGKPMLDGPAREDPLRFNLSHSGELALYALAMGREVGIDVETIRPDFAADAIAQRFFAPAEVDVLRSVPDEDRTHAFFTCWTRKEAFIKARGKGLAIPLDAFEVSLIPGARAAVLVTHDDPEEAGRWTLHELQPGPGYVGALAVAGDGCRTRLHTWTEDIHLLSEERS